jgi:hypothetical protein
LTDFIFHTVSIPLKAEDDWEAAEKALLTAAREICAPFLEKARTHFRDISERHSLDSPAVEPKVHIILPEPGKLNLILRAPIRARRKGRTEQAIIRRYLDLLKKTDSAGSDREPPAVPEPEVYYA